MNGNKKIDIAQAIAATLVMALAVFVTMNQTLPPQALPASTAATDFSAALGFIFALAI